MNQSPEKLFLSRLYALAKMCNAKLDDDILELYDTSLAPLGHARVAAAIEQVIVNRRARDPFPSIRDIRELLEPVNDEQSIAVDAASRIYAAISKYGHNWIDKAKDDWPAEPIRVLGTLAWEVVRQSGGWEAVCRESGDVDRGIFVAQLRELAKSTFRRSKLGQLQSPPQLPGPDAGLTSGTSFNSIGQIIQHALPQPKKGNSK